VPGTALPFGGNESSYGSGLWITLAEKVAKNGVLWLKFTLF